MRAFREWWVVQLLAFASSLIRILACLAVLLGAWTPDASAVDDGPFVSHYSNGRVRFEGTYVNGSLHGRAVEYDQNGRPVYEGTFDNGYLTGTWTEYYPSGQVKLTGTASGSRFHNDLYRPLKTGIWIEYYENGNPRIESEYVNDKRHGRTILYDANGRIWIEAVFHEGTAGGTWTEYYENGQVSSTGDAYDNYGDGFLPAKTGTWTEYNRDGTVIFKGEYLSDSLHGRAVWYHANGRVRIEAQFDRGRLTGAWTAYYDNGQVRATGETYGNGGPSHLAEEPLKTGPWVEYYPNGAVRFEGTYANNNLHGRAVWYYANGQAAIEAEFDNGRLSGTWTAYYDNGRVSATGEAQHSRIRGLNSAEYPLRIGRWVEYYPNGTLSFEGAYVDGMLHGPAVRYHANGRVYIEATYDHGEIKGAWTEYYDNGQVRKKGEAYGNWGEQPLKTGLWTEYYPDGTPYFEGTYENNNLHGRAVEYRPNGRVRLEATFDAGNLTGTWTEYYDNGQIHQTGETYGSADGRNAYGSPLKTGLWLTFNRDGSLREAGLYENNRLLAKLPFETDPFTGLNFVAIDHPDGSRTVYGINRNGIVGSRREAPVDRLP